MTEQPTALWLADWLDVRACGGDNWNAKMNAAAAELRRLYEANEAFGKRQEWWNERMFVLEQQRITLLEALKYHQEQTRPIQRSIDAIKAAEENT